MDAGQPSGPARPFPADSATHRPHQPKPRPPLNPPWSALSKSSSFASNGPVLMENGGLIQMGGSRPVGRVVVSDLVSRLPRRVDFITLDRSAIRSYSIYMYDRDMYVISFLNHLKQTKEHQSTQPSRRRPTLQCHNRRFLGRFYCPKGLREEFVLCTGTLRKFQRASSWQR